MMVHVHHLLYFITSYVLLKERNYFNRHFAKCVKYFYHIDYGNQNARFIIFKIIQERDVQILFLIYIFFSIKETKIFLIHMFSTLYISQYSQIKYTELALFFLFQIFKNQFFGCFFLNTKCIKISIRIFLFNNELISFINGKVTCVEENVVTCTGI